METLKWIWKLLFGASHELTEKEHKYRHAIYVVAGLVAVGLASRWIIGAASLTPDASDPSSGWEQATIAKTSLAKAFLWPLFSAIAFVFSVFEYRVASLFLPQLKKQGSDPKLDSYIDGAEIYKAIFFLAICLINGLIAASVI